VAWNAGRYNRQLRKRQLEIVNLLREHGAPDEMPGSAPGPVYGCTYLD
jgi:hypothetical protein